MISEPEAAAIYAARYLSEDKKREFLKASLLGQLSVRRGSSPIQLLGFFEEFGLGMGWIVQLIMLAVQARIVGYLKSPMRCSGHLLSILPAWNVRRRSLPLSSVFADLLQLGECFVLCDAGCGTVVSSSRSHGFPSFNYLPSHQDVLSYKVTQLKPSLDLEERTIATSLHYYPLSRKSIKADQAYRCKVWVCIYRCKFQAISQQDLGREALPRTGSQGHSSENQRPYYGGKTDESCHESLRWTKEKVLQ